MQKKRALKTVKGRGSSTKISARRRPSTPGQLRPAEIRPAHRKRRDARISSETLRDRGATIVQTLWDFKIGAKLSNIQSGPAVTMYELELDPGIKCSASSGLQDNLAMAMKAERGVRIIAPIPGRNAVGLEIPNAEDHVVRMRPILESPQFRAKTWTLPLILAATRSAIRSSPTSATMPHL